VSRSAAYTVSLNEEESIDGFVSFSKRFEASNIEEKKKMWGERCISLNDVAECFTKFICGHIKKFPFSEGALSDETQEISDVLV